MVGYNEGNFKWFELLPNDGALGGVQTRAPRELFNQNCSFLAFYVYLKDHKAETLARGRGGGAAAGADLHPVRGADGGLGRRRALGLIYPVAQHTDEASASCRENGEGKFLTTSAIQWFVASYLGGQADALTHPDYAVLASDGFEPLPATWVATMGHDPLRDEGHALARRLGAAGVAVTHRHYPDAIHACIHFTAVSAIGLQVMLDLARWLREQV
jgi:acetyl esterase